MQKDLTVFDFLMIPIILYAENKGISREELSKFIKVKVSGLDVTDFRLKGHQYRDLILKIVEQTGDLDIGIRVGEIIKFSNLGILGYVVMASSNFGEVVDNILKYHEIIGNIAHFGIEKVNNQIEFQFLIENEEIIPVQHVILGGYVAGIMNFFYKLTGMEMVVNKIHFNWPKPDNTAEYERIFRTKLHFDQPRTTIFYKNELHKLPVVFSNPKLLSVFEKHAQDCYHELYVDKTYTKRVVKILSNQIDNIPSLEAIAYSFGLSGKTLQIKLKNEGTSYNEIRDKVRYEFSKSILHGNHYSIERICHLLGFSEPSVFYKAFKRWSGMSLNEYRANM